MSHLATIKVSVKGLQAHLKTQASIKASLLVVGEIQFLMGCWAKDLGSPLTVEYISYSVSCPLGLSHMAACFIKKMIVCQQDGSHSLL